MVLRKLGIPKGTLFASLVTAGAAIPGIWTSSISNCVFKFGLTKFICGRFFAWIAFEIPKDLPTFLFENLLSLIFNVSSESSVSCLIDEILFHSIPSSREFIPKSLTKKYSFLGICCCSWSNSLCTWSSFSISFWVKSFSDSLFFEKFVETCLFRKFPWSSLGCLTHPAWSVKDFSLWSGSS